MIFQDRRKEASKSVIIKFVKFNQFNVLDSDGNLKYAGSLNPHNCECPSFIHGNPEKYESSHPDFFQCKHIIRALQMKELADKQDNRLRDSIKRRKDSQVLRGKLPTGWKHHE